jgi:hypothetical protein
LKSNFQTSVKKNRKEFKNIPVLIKIILFFKIYQYSDEKLVKRMDTIRFFYDGILTIPDPCKYCTGTIVSSGFTSFNKSLAFHSFP